MCDEEKEIIDLMRESAKSTRGYADFFDWRSDRDIEEWGAVNTLAESIKADGKLEFTSLKKRGRAMDPPDCEALDTNGHRIAIEVTELVDEQAIKAYKNGNKYVFADWSKAKFANKIELLISRKDSKFPTLKEPPYEGGYFVVIFTDEPMLNRITVESYLKGYNFKKPKHLRKAFLLISYDPSIKKCPYFELQFSS